MPVEVRRTACSAHAWLASYGFRVDRYGLLHEITQQDRDRQVKLAAAAAMARAPRGAKAAAEWLTAYLTEHGGQAPRDQVRRDAETAGFKLATLKKGRVLAGVGFAYAEVRLGGTVWTLPGLTPDSTTPRRPVGDSSPSAGRPGGPWARTALERGGSRGRCARP
jgi:hypothetical protein